MPIKIRGSKSLPSIITVIRHYSGTLPQWIILRREVNYSLKMVIFPVNLKKKKKLLATKGKLIEESIKRYTLKKPIKTIGTI